MSDESERGHSRSDAGGDPLQPVLVQTWIDTRMERDKSLLAVSSGGVGLLLTLLQIFEVLSPFHVIPYLFALAGFMITILAIIGVFHRNAHYVGKLMKGCKPKGDTVLKWLDRTAVVSFIVGILASVLIGVLLTLTNL